MKSTQRLDYNRFADALVERGLVGRDVLNHVLQQCNTTGGLLPDLLVGEEIVSDWELSRVTCEIYNLPFLTVDICPPNPEALEGIDPEYLRLYGIVPLSRFGRVLTVAMPGIVPTEVLEGISLEEGGRVIPVVGSVNTNRRWLQEHLPAPVIPTHGPRGRGLGALAAADDAWAGIFDAGEEAVQQDLLGKGTADYAPPAE
ncbi:MAG: hypothetical protein AB1726_16345 [Planctomycetota bacterium]